MVLGVGVGVGVGKIISIAELKVLRQSDGRVCWHHQRTPNPTPTPNQTHMPGVLDKLVEWLKMYETTHRTLALSRAPNLFPTLFLAILLKP